MKRLSHDLCQHLISLLATYEQHGKFHLIFYWAEADLLGYWKRINPEPATDRETVLWLSSQCKGLAEGLAKIHRYETYSGSSLLHQDSRSRTEAETNANLTQVGVGIPTNPPRLLFGRHGDIKPANVLWFSNPKDSEDKGNLKISDFGIAEFKTQSSRWTRQRGGMPNSGSYRPPECDLPDSIISSSYDIWALGCLYLDFITWCFGGWKYVEEFAR